MPYTPEQKAEAWRNLSSEQKQERYARRRVNYHNETPEQRDNRRAKRREWENNNRDEINRKRRERKATHKKYVIDMLGGCCVGCGTTENLQFDHIDRTTKSCNVVNLLAGKLEKLVEEAQKCQLLCDSCHRHKTLINHDCNHLAEGKRVVEVHQEGERTIVILEPQNYSPSNVPTNTETNIDD
jgi:hypothetical protein